MKLIRYSGLFILSTMLCGTELNAADWQQELATLKEDVQMLKRQVQRKYEQSTSSQTNEMFVKAGKREEGIRELNTRLEDMEHQLEEANRRFEKINRDIEIRLKMLQGKDIPDELSVSAVSAPEIFAAPLADKAARTVVGDEIQGDDLAPLDGQGEFGYEVY